ncbi:hypothetical protein P0136_05620 [Lentisphaerota bacterium ZTH]|nr:hypothetical protein JYG24_03265 [Lentisphaerota bacterium]WET07470.1 hypothetical protein P0136_05620 [Lentisphaerota bacterium ZTH]
MALYYVNAHDRNGKHEVHKEGCEWLGIVEKKEFLGSFTNCRDAVKKAKKYFHDVDGCAYCSKECHTK